MHTEPMHTENILKHLRRNGQMLDSEIAIAAGISLKQVHSSLESLTDKGMIMRCNVTRYQGGKPVQSVQCRISGYVPPASPGRKPGS